MRHTSKAEIQSVLRLDGPQRFRHLVKRAADEECVWGLWNDGWALMAEDDGTQVLPIWPASEYADLSRVGEWEAYSPKAINLYELLDKLLPTLQEEDVRIGIFPTPEGRCVVPRTDEFIDAIRQELQRYA